MSDWINQNGKSVDVSIGTQKSPADSSGFCQENILWSVFKQSGKQNRHWWRKPEYMQWKQDFEFKFGRVNFLSTFPQYISWIYFLSIFPEYISRVYAMKTRFWIQIRSGKFPELLYFDCTIKSWWNPINCNRNKNLNFDLSWVGKILLRNVQHSFFWF